MGEDGSPADPAGGESGRVGPEPEETPPFSVVPDPADAGGDLRKLGVLGGVLALVSLVYLLRRRGRRS